MDSVKYPLTEESVMWIWGMQVWELDTLSSEMRRFKQSNNSKMKTRGAEFKFSYRSFRLFRNYVVRNRFHSDVRHSCQVYCKYWDKSTLKYARERHQASYVSIRKPFKRHDHYLTCLRWPRKDESWTQGKWMHVLFTDELFFTLRLKSNLLCVWRKEGELWMKRCTVLTFGKATELETYRAGSLHLNALLL